MLYAAYGSNLHPTRLARRIQSARPRGTGFVPDWSLKCHKKSQDGSAKFNIVAGSQGVHVGIFEISVADKTKLDKIEGVGVGYRVIELPVPQFGNCVTYVAEDSYIDELLQPYEWYKKITTLGARAQSFPDAYVQKIDEMPACEDPDVLRHAKNWRILAAMESRVLEDAHR